MLRVAEKTRLAIGLLFGAGAAVLLAAGYKPDPVTVAATLYALLAPRLLRGRRAEPAVYASVAAAAAVAGYRADFATPAGLAVVLSSIDTSVAVYAVVTALGSQGA